MVSSVGRETLEKVGLLEETGYVPSGDGSIYCLVSTPAGRDARGAVVLLGPFAEEKKSSLRPLVETARSLAAAGFTALRVDFRGTGDASGLSEELSVESMVEDALCAVGFARSECGAKRVALLGLRLGGAVAVLAAGRARTVGTYGRPDDAARVNALVLIEPVVSGKAYVRSLSRQQAIRRMLTSGSGKRSQAEDDEEGSLDLDGLAVGRGFLAGLEKVDVTRAAVELRSEPGPRLVGQAVPGRPDDRHGRVKPELARREAGSRPAGPAALVLQVGPRARPSRELTVLAEALGESARLEAVVARPFWLQTDYVDPAPVTARVLEFIKSAFGALHE